MRPDGFELWETQEAVEACRIALGVTEEQERRWRWEGLLLRAEQVSNRYSGSFVFYEPGYCAQMEAAAALYRIKHRAAYVGRQLWLQGFRVDEVYWLPWLKRSATTFDLLAPRIAPFLDRDDMPVVGLAKGKLHGPIGSRVEARVSGDARTALLWVMLDVAAGRFDGFEHHVYVASKHKRPLKADDRPLDHNAVLSAMDIAAADNEVIGGKRLNFDKEIERTLKEISKAFVSGSMCELLENHLVIEEARDDALNGLRIGVALYDAMSWIYGPRAFDARLIAWIAKKLPDAFLPMAILGIARLRRTRPDALLSSADIAALAVRAEEMKDASLAIKQLRDTDPRFREVFAGRRLRAALTDPAIYAALLRDISRIVGGPDFTRPQIAFSDFRREENLFPRKLKVA